MWSETYSIKEYLEKGMIPKTIKKLSDNLFIYYPLYLIPFRRFKFISKLNEDLNLFFLKVLVTFLGFSRNIKKKIVWLFYPYLVKITNILGKEYFIIYDCVDFFASGKPSEVKEVEGNQKELLANADLVVANSKALQSYLKKWRKKVCLDV